MIQTLLLLYLGGVIAEILEQAGHWRTFRSLPRITALIREDISSTISQRALGIGILVGIAVASLMNGFKWPYRLTRMLLKSRTGHPYLADEVLELSMELWVLQAIADYRIDTRMSIHEAQRQLDDTYSAIMENSEELLERLMPEGMLKPPPSRLS